MADELFSVSAGLTAQHISHPTHTASTTAASAVFATHTLSAQFLPEHNEAQAAAVPLDISTTIRCTPEAWRFGDAGMNSWVFVPQRLIQPASDYANDARYRVTLELMQTEESYGKAVKLVKNTLMGPLLKGSILPAPTVAKLFSCCDKISELSDAIRDQAKAKLDAWDVHMTVSDIFTTHLRSDGLLGGSALSNLYVQYVNNFEQSTRTLRAIEDNAEWTFYLKHWALLLEAMGAGKQSIGSLLIQPVQRIPRYKLMLEQLLKGTSEDHPDHSPTANVLEQISAIATKVNNAIKRREAVEAVYELQAEFTGGELVRPGRYLVKRADGLRCRLVTPPPAEGKDKEERKERVLTVVVFSDALLLAERTFGSSKLSTYAWFAVDSVSQLVDGDNGGVRLVLRQGSETLAFTLPSTEAEADWVQGIERLVRLNAHAHAPVAGVGAQPTASKAGGSAPGTLQRGSSSFYRVSSRFGGGGSGSGASGSATAMRTESGILAGWLQKKGGGGADGTQRNWAKGGRRNWKARWVVVTSNQFIAWYESDKKRDLKGNLALHGAQVAASERAGGFWVVRHGHVHAPRVLRLLVDAAYEDHAPRAHDQERMFVLPVHACTAYACARTYQGSRMCTLLQLTNSRSLELMAENADVAARWIAVIQAAANQVLEGASGKGFGDADAALNEPPPPVPARPRAVTNAMAKPKVRAVALYSYETSEHGELSVQAGEVFEILNRDAESDGWLFCLLGEEYGCSRDAV